MKLGPYELGPGAFPVIAGPCVIESEKHALGMATRLAEMARRLDLDFIFKTSFDKANRTSPSSYRGVPLPEALPIFQKVRSETGFPVVTDVHTVDQPEQLAGAVDLLQIPAFLCRQTDLLTAAAVTGLPVMVKKGQFLAPGDAGNIAAKLKAAGCEDFAIIERGVTFGYNNLVSDMRSIPIMQEQGIPVIFDATHSAQLPGGQGTTTGGLRQYIPAVARAAVAAGCDGIFMEVHDRPEQAKSDAATQWPLDKFEQLAVSLLTFRESFLKVGTDD